MRFYLVINHIFFCQIYLNLTSLHQVIWKWLIIQNFKAANINMQYFWLTGSQSPWTLSHDLEKKKKNLPDYIFHVFLWITLIFFVCNKLWVSVPTQSIHQYFYIVVFLFSSFRRDVPSEAEGQLFFAYNMHHYHPLFYLM